MHHQPRAHCLETTTESQRRFWHAHDNHAGSSSAGEGAARLRRALWKSTRFRNPPPNRSTFRADVTAENLILSCGDADATAVADAHHLFCELLRAHWAVEEKDSGAFAADLRQKVGNATWAALRPHERLPFKSFKACQRTGRCLRVHAMRLFGVARFQGVAAVLARANALAPTAGARVAHVFNDGPWTWPKLGPRRGARTPHGGGPRRPALTSPAPARAAWARRDASAVAQRRPPDRARVLHGLARDVPAALRDQLCGNPEELLRETRHRADAVTGKTSAPRRGRRREV